MAKRKRPKTLWVKIDGQWFKAPITYGRTQRYTHGLKVGGWDKRPHVDMSRRSEFCVTRPKGRLEAENI